jgi:hypothetical protein
VAEYNLQSSGDHIFGALPTTQNLLSWRYPSCPLKTVPEFFQASASGGKKEGLEIEGISSSYLLNVICKINQFRHSELFWIEIVKFERL